MRWTTPDDLKKQVQKLWDRGVLLSMMAGRESLFPLRLVIKRPTSRELSEEFPEVRAWIAELSGSAKHYRLVWQQVNHRILGVNLIPAEIWIDQLGDALSLIGRQKSADQFAIVLEHTRLQQPELLPWLAKRPLRALELAQSWPQLLSVVAWLKNHPCPKIYLRQIDLPEVHTKFIEAHRGVLSELFDLILPLEQINLTATGTSGFCRRYGFLDKPARVRFRLLDPDLRLLPQGCDQDITLTATAFATLDLPVSKVFITENEINFLAFPFVQDAILIFGAGYGFDHLASASWLNQKDIYYWGDIDTHGFAILNQLRGFFSHARSLLMDQRTLLAHQNLWVVEEQPERGNLTRLNTEEAELYYQLRDNRLGNKIRLEQERIGFCYLKAALDQM